MIYVLFVYTLEKLSRPSNTVTSATSSGTRTITDATSDGTAHPINQGD